MPSPFRTHESPARSPSLRGGRGGSACNRFAVFGILHRSPKVVYTFWPRSLFGPICGSGFPAATIAASPPCPPWRDSFSIDVRPHHPGLGQGRDRVQRAYPINHPGLGQGMPPCPPLPNNGASLIARCAWRWQAGPTHMLKLLKP